MRDMSEKLRLQLNRTIGAKRSSVFDAWTKPELMRRWLAPGAMTVTAATADLRTGGDYRIEMSGENGSGKWLSAAVCGAYKEIIPDQLIRFSWAWSGDPSPETLVMVELKGADARTEVTLTHDGLASQEALDKHLHGWLGCFEKLETLCESLGLANTAAKEE